MMEDYPGVVGSISPDIGYKATQYKYSALRESSGMNLIRITFRSKHPGAVGEAENPGEEQPKW